MMMTTSLKKLVVAIALLATAVMGQFGGAGAKPRQPISPAGTITPSASGRTCVPAERRVRPA